MQKTMYPTYFMVVEATEDSWVFYKNTIVYNPMSIDVPVEPEQILSGFELTVPKVVVELFRISAGRLGYYLANLKDKKYYYCGDSLESVRAKFLELGVISSDPMEVN